MTLGILRLNLFTDYYIFSINYLKYEFTDYYLSGQDIIALLIVISTQTVKIKLFYLSRYFIYEAVKTKLVY